MSNPYRYRSIKEKVPGHKKIGLENDVHEYHSKLEARFAKILIAQGIKFTPHVKYECFDKDGHIFTYEVDFLFVEPQKFLGISPIVNAIEVKGVLTRKDLLRIDALKFRHGVRTYIATNTLIEMWERDGIR